MMNPGELFRRLRYFVNRDELSRELEEEMRLHVAQRAERSGEYEARRRFGNASHIQQRSRDMWGMGRLDDWRNDVRFAVRRLAQRPAFSAAVIGIMAIGIGATTAMFSAVDAALLKPLPFRNSSQLVIMPQVGVPDANHSDMHSLNVLDVRKLSESFSDVSAYTFGAANLNDRDNPQRIAASGVSIDFFNTLGVAPQRGRAFTAGDVASDADRAVLISDGLWQRQYGGRDIAGLHIEINKRSFTVIGVMPRGFNFPQQSDVWFPEAIPYSIRAVPAFSGSPFRVIARVRDGVTLNVASARLMTRWQQFAASVGDAWDTKPLMEGLVVSGSLQPLQNVLVGDRKMPLIILLSATGLLLLVACANVTNLLIAQSTIRQREIAVRQVMGATRGRILRQLLTESVMLASSGALLGVLVAPFALTMISSLVPDQMRAVSPPTVDWRVLAFASVLALLTGIVFGAWPAFSSARRDPGDVVKSGRGRSATARHSGAVRRALVGGELAITTVLLIGACLMLRSFDQLMNEDAGLRPANVGTLEFQLPSNGAGRGERLAVLDAVLSRLSAVNGIQAAGLTNDLPLLDKRGIGIGIQTVSAKSTAKSPRVRFLQASPGYFSAMGIPLISGRPFVSTDDSLKRVAIVSASVAAYYWPGMDAVGRTFEGPGLAGEDRTYTVVGVVGDLRERKLEDDPTLQLYVPIKSVTASSMAMVARSTLPRAALLRTMTEVVRSVDPAQAVFNVRMMEDVIGTAVTPRRTNTVLIATFALLALALASVGVYAVVSFSVSNRSKELGIRSALGASGGRLLAMISREMAWVAVGGVTVGLIGAWAWAKTVQSLVYGIEVHDTVSFVLVPLVLLLPTLFATVVPAWRAYRVNPAEVMRAD